MCWFKCHSWCVIKSFQIREHTWNFYVYWLIEAKWRKYAYMRQYTRPSLFQIMACRHCRSAPSHYLNYAQILLTGLIGTNISEILIEIHTFSCKKMHLKMSSAKWRLFCLGLNVFYQSIEFIPWYDNFIRVHNMYFIEVGMICQSENSKHDDVIKWKHFQCCWPLVQGIPRSAVNSLICA